MSTLEQVRAAVAAVPDPELPVLSIEDLGILRDVSLDGDRVVGGPQLDGAQNGYGAAYRLYRCAEGWVALAVPDQSAWDRLRDVVGADQLQSAPPPLRLQGSDPQPEELVLERERIAIRDLAELPHRERHTLS